MLKQRADRLPSALGFELSTPSGDFAATIVNVSPSGAFAEGSLPLSIGEQVSLTALQQTVGARVVRVSPRGAALQFEQPLDPVQLENLRQYRALHML